MLQREKIINPAICFMQKTAINAAHKIQDKFSESMIMARGAGIEPTIADLEAAVIPFN